MQDLLERSLQRYGRALEELSRHPVSNMVPSMRRRRVQAIQEAQRDVLNTYGVSDRLGTNEIDKNNYRDYAKQVDGAYKMYDGLTDYGSEIFAAVADLRVAFIAGEGLSFYSDNKARDDFVQRFLHDNLLDGSRLLDAVLMGELEGKVLFTLAPNKDKKTVDARLFSWHANKYKITRDDLDYEKLTKIAYMPDNAQGKEKEIGIDGAVYLRLGGCNRKKDDTPTKLGKVLTQCENASRAAFDLRKNSHLFAKVSENYETKSPQDAAVIKGLIESQSIEIGDGYTGSARKYLLEPTGSAADALIKDMLNSLRFVSAMTGVAIHWLAWPELMSNRATAENMLEVINAATKKERLIYQEGIGTLIDKACIMAVDSNVADREILEPGESEVRLPLISLAALQQLADVWIPVLDKDAISMFTFRNMLPGIDPRKEAKLVEKERAEAAKRSPMHNAAADGLIDNLRDGGDGDGVTDTGDGAAQGDEGQGRVAAGRQ
jgi:hypothetical protein